MQDSVVWQDGVDAWSMHDEEVPVAKPAFLIGAHGVDGDVDVKFCERSPLVGDTGGL